MSLLRLLPPINNVVLGIIIGIAITFSFETRKVAIYELNRMLRIDNFFRRWQFFFLFLCFFFRCWSELRNFIRKYRNAFTKNGCFFFDCGIGLIGIITWNWYVRYAVLKPNHTTIIKRHASFGFPSFSFPFSNHSERHVNCISMAIGRDNNWFDFARSKRNIRKRNSIFTSSSSSSSSFHFNFVDENSSTQNCVYKANYCICKGQILLYRQQRTTIKRIKMHFVSNPIL